MNAASGAIWRIALGTAMALGIAGGVGAAVLTVDDSGGADYARIQDAINNESNGDIP